MECATVASVEVLPDFHLRISFTDGVTGDVDLAPRIRGRGGLFAALEEPTVFGQVRVDADLGTIVWPNGADVCPDLLYDMATHTEAGSRNLGAVSRQSA